VVSVSEANWDLLDECAAVTAYHPKNANDCSTSWVSVQQNDEREGAVFLGQSKATRCDYARRVQYQILNDCPREWLSNRCAVGMPDFLGCSKYDDRRTRLEWRADKYAWPALVKTVRKTIDAFSGVIQRQYEPFGDFGLYIYKWYAPKDIRGQMSTIHWRVPRTACCAMLHVFPHDEGRRGHTGIYWDDRRPEEPYEHIDHSTPILGEKVFGTPPAIQYDVLECELPAGSGVCAVVAKCDDYRSDGLVYPVAVDGSAIPVAMLNTFGWADFSMRDLEARTEALMTLYCTDVEPPPHVVPHLGLWEATTSGPDYQPMCIPDGVVARELINQMGQSTLSVITYNVVGGVAMASLQYIGHTPVNYTLPCPARETAPATKSLADYMSG